MGMIESNLKAINGKHSEANRLQLSQYDEDWPINFDDIIEERLDLYKLTTYALNKDRNVYNWYQYLQGFSYKLVEALLEELGSDENSVVLDPWCGVGTTNLVCQSKSIRSYGVDISPLAVFVSNLNQ